MISSLVTDANLDAIFSRTEVNSTGYNSEFDEPITARLQHYPLFCLYNNQINARALIGQSAVGYCYYKPTEKSRVFEIII